MKNSLKTALIAGASVMALSSAAFADEFDVPGGDLKAALNAFAMQARVALIVSGETVKGVRTQGVHGDLPADVALARILKGTGLTSQRTSSGEIGVVPLKSLPRGKSSDEAAAPLRLAAAQAAATSVETVVVTSSKIKGDIQTVPIAITALSQEQLTSRQIAGGPDLVKEVPNLTFTKTNFSGYSIQIRGIGTQAISVSTDPAVAVALNDIPFIRNHFFEQEFYDVSQVEVLRGPQGTLYGRNATAGVVNVISAKPTDQFEAMASVDWGNFTNRRYEGMVNIPVVDDRLDIRAAAEWTKRDGYSFNETTGQPIDGRDLWSSRLTIGLKPTSEIQAYLVWEHFSENDDRLRSSKQLCETDHIPRTVDGVPVPPIGSGTSFGVFDPAAYLDQSCKMTSLYSPSAFEVPEGFSLPYVKAAKFSGLINTLLDPYASTTQSTNLRVIESTVNPHYQAKNDVIELNADYAITPALTFTSQTGYNQDSLFSTEDYNRFNTSPGIFLDNPLARPGELSPDPSGLGHCQGNVAPGSVCHGQPINSVCTPDGKDCVADSVFCDPQIGCADKLVGVDLSDETAWQLSQEFRLTSNFSGPLNFSVGGNFLHYQTEENYYVFINALTIYTLGSYGLGNVPYVPGVSDNHECLFALGYGYDPTQHFGDPSQSQCNYIDPNPINNLNNMGHNYFLSQNPYMLNSYAGFGEVYYNVAPTLKLTGGLRWTDDQKRFVDVPSELLTDGWGYAVTGNVNQQWSQLTGRAAANWTPKFDFTDQTLVYASFAHGYKAGGANPPGAAFIGNATGNILTPIHPLTFKPEFIDAYELGTKNTLLDGGLTLNGDVFYYNYTGYQISRIVDRTAINDNFNATVKGAELEAMWEPVPGLKFNFAGGYEATRVDNGQSSIDLMDRTAGNPNWMVVRPYPTQASNCILPTYVVAAILQNPSADAAGLGIAVACGGAYSGLTNPIGVVLDPVTALPYTASPTDTANSYSGSGFPPYIPPGYQGFDAAAGNIASDPYTGQNTSNGVDYGPAPNFGEGFAKKLSGNELPNAPHFTTSLSADYTLPVSEDWAATLHSDFYWQSQSWARVFNDRPYDKLRGYSNVNLALILTSASGWQVMGYLKNVFDTTAITGDFLNSDDSGLTTNVFLTDPRLFGVRVTKNW
jgi:iron complex outermembrane receptor protein